VNCSREISDEWLSNNIDPGGVMRNFTCISALVTCISALVTCTRVVSHCFSSHCYYLCNTIDNLRFEDLSNLRTFNCREIVTEWLSNKIYPGGVMRNITRIMYACHVTLLIASCTAVQLTVLKSEIFRIQASASR
jgi:hypothetical protein